MHSNARCFTYFTSAIDGYDLPEAFTFPFYYEPHPLCILAAEQLQSHIEQQTVWQHDFGLAKSTELVAGKMFGVLVVRDLRGKLGFLSAFSGKVAEQSILPGFVPPVFDMAKPNSEFFAQQQYINKLNDSYEQLQKNPEIAALTKQLSQIKLSQQQAIATQQAINIAGRKGRKEQRLAAEQSANESELAILNQELAKQSVFQKNYLKHIKQQWQDTVDEVQQQLSVLTTELKQLQEQRKLLSNKMQLQLFAQYQFLNINGEQQDLNAIFSKTPYKVPPAGSGDCAAPKLLQYAFNHQLTPIAMAEFWWGGAPKSAIRKHKNYYPACHSKCQPILGHMLQGMKVEKNPLLTNPAIGKTIDIIYQDNDIAIINKPAEFLSVPGKNIEDSVYLRMKHQFPHATGPLIVHRLDMSTSGLMVIALNKNANKHLQKQFINRDVKKRYVALLNSIILSDEGTINLPMCLDFDDRPRQKVCFDEGKPAKTYWQVIARTNTQSKLYLYPKTGRTHQLRVHCAHPLGLNSPIVGDDHYGIRGERLHLHAQRLEFQHPVSKKWLCFEVDETF